MTPSALATSSGSTSLPLYLKLEVRAMTFRPGSCERLFIRLSLRPSERYSISLSAVVFVNGNTAIESIATFEFFACK